MRILKKYPNRRLYDTEKSCFVSLDAVRRLVIEGVDFQVLDSRTGEDLTRSVLLQIINEQEARTGGSLLTDQVLRQLIRFYGGSLYLAMREYLERSVALFMEQHRFFHEQLPSAMSGNPFEVMAKVTEQNLALWQELLAGARKREPPVAEPPQPDPAGDAPKRKPGAD